MNIFCVVVVMKNSRIALFLSSLMFLSSNNSMAVEKIHSSQKTKIKNSSQKTKVKNARTKKLKKIETKESPKLKNLSGKSVHLNSDMNVKIKESKKENFKASFHKISDKVIDYVCEHPVSTPFKVAGGLLGTKIIYDLASGLIGDKQKMKSYLRDKYEGVTPRYPAFSLVRTLHCMHKRFGKINANRQQDVGEVKKEETNINSFLGIMEGVLEADYAKRLKSMDDEIKLFIARKFVEQFVIGRYRMACDSYRGLGSMIASMARNKLRGLSIKETMIQCTANIENSKKGTCFEYTFMVAHLLCELGLKNYICKQFGVFHFYNVCEIGEKEPRTAKIDAMDSILEKRLVYEEFEGEAWDVISKPLDMENIKDKMSTLFTNNEKRRKDGSAKSAGPDWIIWLVS